MSFSIATPESFKEKAKLLRKLLNENFKKADISHSQSLELLSQVFDCKDWNTASAKLTAFSESVADFEFDAVDRVKALASMRSETPEIKPVRGMTVGEIRKALEPYGDSATADADYEFNLGEFLNATGELDNPEDTIHQEFAITSVERVDDEYVNLRLTLQNEDFSTPDGMGGTRR
jgi:hypothetical protein